ncbi:hypothetical protein [Caulobacter hibisci]|uniref:Uncharacterized protein n=1 Tax=Caulobacter hibisci TaxID=2035993 RepID=A0ABS0SU83_9CAUL|nr:hypothetical protein [Caulobacter hibisci]MBI1683210.1 hypothetical protein [Caulobacter hibisci]
MQKQVAEQHDYQIETTEASPSPAPPTGEIVRLAGASATPVDSPARRLQQDLAAAFGARQGWTVKRTVLLGAAYHVVVLVALGLAASETLSHLFS